MIRHRSHTAIAMAQVLAKPGFGKCIEALTGAKRWFCGNCGSLTACEFDYLPGQIYLPVGILDFAAATTPMMHCHVADKLPWLDLKDDLPKHHGSGRHQLNATYTR